MVTPWRMITTQNNTHESSQLILSPVRGTEPSRQVSLHEAADEIHNDGGSCSYTIVSELGEGSFAKCVKLKQRYSGIVCVGKIIPKRDLSKSHTKKLKKLPYATRLSIMRCEDEMEIHSSLKHPFIVAFHEWFCDRRTGKVCFLLEYCQHGTLRHIIDQCPGNVIPNEFLKRWMQELLSAVTYLHEDPILVAHRDINPANLLIDDSLSLKLCDFGLATKLASNGMQIDGLRCASVGTLNYIAPEVILKYDSDLRAADVWSCGVVVYEMMMGRVPFSLQPEGTRTHGVSLPQVPSNQRLCTASAELIGASLCRDPEHRPTARVLFTHRFFASSATDDHGNAVIANSSTQQLQSWNPPDLLLENKLATEQSMGIIINAPQVDTLVKVLPAATASSAIILPTASSAIVVPLQVTFGPLFLDPSLDTRWIKAAKEICFEAQRKKMKQREHCLNRFSYSDGEDDGGSVATEDANNCGSERSSNDISWPDLCASSLDDIGSE